MHAELDVWQRSSKRQQILRTDGRTGTTHMQPTSRKLRDWRYEMSNVYLHSGARYVLQNSFLLHHYTGSSVSGGLCGVLQSCFVMVSERPEYRHSDGRSVLVLVGIRKYRKVTNLENMTHEADKSSLTDNAVCGLAFSCLRNHFPVDHNSRRRSKMLPLKTLQ
jgi:hypothetical protein